MKAYLFMSFNAMKMFSLLLIACFFSLESLAQKTIETPFEIQGTIGLPKYDARDRVIYLTFFKNGKYVTDSAVIKQNKFAFKNTADIDIKARLRFTKPSADPKELRDPNILDFYLSKGVVPITAKGYLKNASVKGSPINDSYFAYKKILSKSTSELNELSWSIKDAKPGDSALKKTLQKKVDSIQEKRSAWLLELLSKDIKKPYASDELLTYMVYTSKNGPDVNKCQMFFDQIPAKQKLTETGKEISARLAQEKESTFTINVLKDLDFYDGYAQPVNAKMPRGVTALSNTEVIRKLSDDERESIGKTLKVKLTLKSRCDNYDRIGNVLLVTMPKGEKFDKDKCEEFEMLRFITPFMYHNREPDHVPYEAVADQFVNVIKQADKDVYLLVAVGGTTGAGQAEVTGCDGSNVTFNVSVELVSDKEKTDNKQKAIALLDSYSLDGKDKTDGKNSKQVSFELANDTKATTLYMISSGHGAAEGGEEYNWRTHVIDLDGKEYIRLDMSQDCSPYEIYNTQGNGIYTGDISKDRRSWCPGGAVPIRIVNLGPLPKGRHSLKISIPDADFEKTDSKYYVSAYLVLQ